ncbi:SRPBCC family protein [Pararhizobium sp. DWP1-1-3]|uniref:SRPBCC family protein n=1 Tax=Pararhizobium sp. DWP1-1-3 TaxID=2804652 RepID=UPI003CF9F4E8
MAAMEAKIVHITIERNWRDVYAFAAKPDNMPLWASGLAEGLEPDGEEWAAHGALGNARIRFTPLNDFGVLDHRVTLETGLAVHNALRVVPNGSAAEVMFTLLRQLGMSNEQFDSDADWVKKDLIALKARLET